MARTLDAPFPTVTPDTHPQPWAPNRVVVALERLPLAPYTWDSDDEAVCWDDPDPNRFVWDAPFIGGGYTDVWCDLVGLDITHGEPDDADVFGTGSATLQIRDPDGRYRNRDESGRLIYYAPGRRLSVWAVIDTAKWWLFNGRIGTWRDDMQGNITVEAFTGTAELAQPAGFEWSTGADGNTPATRLTAIATRFAYTGPKRFETGQNTLALILDQHSPLEAMQQVAWSDGGILFSDADDTLVFKDRTWRTGRTDQTKAPTVSDNICGVDVVLWEVETVVDDSRLAAQVVLQNTADTPLVATATAPYASIASNTVFTHPGDDLWKMQGEGDGLAQWILDARDEPTLALDIARIYLHDTRFNYWPSTIDRRIGDQVRYWHEDVFETEADFIDVTVLLKTIRHMILPDQWIVEWETTPVSTYHPVAYWDRTGFTWDDPSDDNVWR